MAGTVVVTETILGSMKKVSFAWTSSAGGAADGATTYTYDGKIVGFATVPSGAAAPTDNYDITLKDADSLDVLLGQGIDRDTANTEYKDGSVIGAVASSILTLGVTNAGNAKAGTAVVWIR